MLLQRGAPITYVSKQLGHKDAAITLRVYAHWLPQLSGRKLVDLLDDGHPARVAVSRLFGVVSRIFVSWNQLETWLRQVEALRTAA